MLYHSSCTLFYIPNSQIEMKKEIQQLSISSKATTMVHFLIFHMNKTFPWVPIFFTLWSWPWSLTHSLKTLTLLITFEQWVLELWYFTWVFLVIRPFRGYHNFLPCDLDLGVDPFFENFNLGYNFWTVSAELWYFTWVFLVLRPFRVYHYFLPCELDLWVWRIFWKL